MNRSQQAKPVKVKQQQRQQPKRSLTTKKTKKVSQLQQKSLRKFATEAAPPPPAGAFNAEAVDFNEQPDADAFQQEKAFSQEKYGEIATKSYIKQDNPNSFHAPIYSARPLKVNINNIFDPRVDYKMDSANFTLKFEIGHDGQNILADMNEKSEWMDTHITNDWLDTMMTRYCPHVSKKAKQIKPSNARQGKLRKLWKQTKEKRLASNIRAAIDNTPRFAELSDALAEAKQLYGTYLPEDKAIIDYEKSGKGVEARLRAKGKDVNYKNKLLRQFQESV
jgi:hypothetical protein